MNKSTDTPTLIAAFALAEEKVTLSIPGYHTVNITTGVGKTMAAMRLTEAILRYRPEAVINIGSAGTSQHEVGKILVGRKFLDRDFEHLRLPGITYYLENRYPLPPALQFWYEQLLATATGPEALINTGDNFVTADEHLAGDAVDMEAFALAIVCREFQIPLVSIKYITDIIGQNSVKAWAEKLSAARQALSHFLENASLASH